MMPVPAFAETLPSSIGAPEPRLITIPISHFCEKARWALDRAGIPYREERHVQGVHRIAAHRAGGGRTVPVLVAPDGVVTESAQIVAYADRDAPSDRRLYPAAGPARDEVAGLERGFDTGLGPHGRRWMYFHVLPHLELARAYNCTGVPAWERRLFVPLYPVASRYIKSRLDITPATSAESEAAVGLTFDAVAGRLGDGRRYLCGDAFSAADLAFCCLAASVLMPAEYGVPLPRVDELPAAMAEGVRAFRAHPAGEFALRVFREDRPTAAR